jgi:hypothetical protein
MRNDEVLTKEQGNVEIVDIKAKREEYIAEYIEANKGQMSMCGMSLSRAYKCKTCEAEFDTFPDDAKYCPVCSSTDLRVIPPGEMQVRGRINQRIMDEAQKIMDENEAQIKELRSQKLSKKAIADKLGISTLEVSLIVGIKERTLPQEKIDYIRNEYLSGRSEWEIKTDLGRVSEERVQEVTGDLCQEIKKAYDQGTRPEDIGKKIGIQGHDQAIFEIVNRFIKLGWSRPEPRSNVEEKELPATA